MKFLFAVFLACPTFSQQISASFVGGYRKGVLPVTSEYRKKGGTSKAVHSGSAFFVQYKSSGTSFVFLVTAKHLLSDANQLKLTANIDQRLIKPEMKSISTEQIFPLEMDNVRTWASPNDDDVDIAVFPTQIWTDDKIRETRLESALEDFKSGRSTEPVASIGLIELGEPVKAQDLDEPEQLLDITYYGYPLGIISTYSVSPIARSGRIALSSLRGVNSYPPTAFLIDGAIYPGNSGGPVVLKTTLFAGTSASISTHLVGVVADYLPYSDYAVSVETKRLKAAYDENSGLGIVFPSIYIKEAIENWIRENPIQ